jgi:hypothetical protein
MNEEQKRRNIFIAIAVVAAIAAVIGVSAGVRTLAPQPEVITLPVDAGAGGKAGEVKVNAASGAPVGVDTGRKGE